MLVQSMFVQAMPVLALLEGARLMQTMLVHAMPAQGLLAGNVRAGNAGRGKR
jgi:hypothetical protein